MLRCSNRGGAVGVPCNQCGAVNTDDARFCAVCGGAVGAGPSPSAPTPSAPSANATQPPPPPPPPAPLPRQTPTGGPLNPATDAKMLTIWATAGVVVAVVIAGFLASRGGLMPRVFAGLNKMTSSAVSAASSKSSSSQGVASPSTGGSGTSQTSGSSGSANSSYDALMASYKKIGALGREIGVAKDKSGFAYKTFNVLINKSRSKREQLVGKANALLEKVNAARDELDQLQVDSAYDSQKTELLDLYDLLVRRVTCMRDAAEIAVDSPSASAWLPTLQPESKNSRKAFDAAYPQARPTQQ
jgi:hypothetical protein